MSETVADPQAPEADTAAARAFAADPGLAPLLWLDEVDPRHLSRRGLLEALVALERTKVWVEARQQHLLAALAAEPAGRRAGRIRARPRRAGPRACR